MFEILVLLLFIVVAGYLLYPLVFPNRIAPLGPGLETDDPATRWAREKNRLVALLRDNDVALAEGRIDEDTHQKNNSRMSVEADRVLDQLRRIRESYALVESDNQRHTSVTSFVFVPAIIAVFSISVGVSWFASKKDLDLTVSPHVTGEIPLAEADILSPLDNPSPFDIPAPLLNPAPLASPAPLANPAPVDTAVADSGGPDIAAMVARLEARVWDGDASEDDYAMLLRSYDVLDRKDESVEVLAQATSQFPDNIGLGLSYLRLAVELPDLDSSQNQDILDRSNDLMVRSGNIDEARWYRTLMLIRLDRLDEALSDLRTLNARLGPDHPARPLIREFMTEIEG